MVPQRHGRMTGLWELVWQVLQVLLCLQSPHLLALPLLPLEVDLEQLLLRSLHGGPSAARLHAQQALVIGRNQHHHLHPHCAPSWLPPHPGCAGLRRAGPCRSCYCIWAWWSLRRSMSPASQTPRASVVWCMALGISTLVSKTTKACSREITPD